MSPRRPPQRRFEKADLDDRCLPAYPESAVEGDSEAGHGAARGGLSGWIFHGGGVDALLSGVLCEVGVPDLVRRA
jgi:hypothetical protein